MKCCVKSCVTRDRYNSQKEQPVGMFMFPSAAKNRSRYAAWLSASGQAEAELPTKKFLCELHFEEDQFEPDNLVKQSIYRQLGFSTMKKRLKPSALPTIQIAAAVAASATINGNESSPASVSDSNSTSLLALDSSSSSDNATTSHSTLLSHFQPNVTLSVSAPPDYSPQLSTASPHHPPQTLSRPIQTLHAPSTSGLEKTSVELGPSPAKSPRLSLEQTSPHRRSSADIAQEEVTSTPLKPLITTVSSPPLSPVVSSCSARLGRTKTRSVQQRSLSADSGKTRVECVCPCNCGARVVEHSMSISMCDDSMDKTFDPDQTDNVLQMSLDDRDDENLEDSDYVEYVIQGRQAEQKKCQEESEIFLVYKSSLLHLFKFCPTCGAPISGDLAFTVTGTKVSVKTECLQGHNIAWSSQPDVGRKPLGNIAVSSAIFLCGLSFAEMKRFAMTLGLAFISQTAYDQNVKKYVSPIVRTTWLAMRKEIIEDELDNGDGMLMGDAQFHSPGHDAYKGVYTVMSVRNGKVVELIFMMRGMAPGDMEKSGCRVLLQRLQETLGDKFNQFLTDRHLGISKMIREDFKNLEHCYDPWHMGRNALKKFKNNTRKKSMERLAVWQQAFYTHFCWCIANCKSDPLRLKELWLSLLKHVTGQHVWNDMETIFGCEHEELPRDFTLNTMYLDEDDEEFAVLEKIVTNKTFITDLQRARHNCHTGPLEVYHAMRGKYSKKRTDQPIDGFTDRGLLAAMDHNHNTGRQVVKQRVVYSKVSSKHVYKNIYEDKDYTWRLELHRKVLDIEHTPARETYEEDFQKLMFPFPVPRSSAPARDPTVEMPYRPRFKAAEEAAPASTAEIAAGAIHNSP